MRSLLVLLSLLTVIRSVSQAHADYILDIDRVGSEFVQQSSVVSFDIRISGPDGTPANQLKAFTLFFDITAPVGKGMPLDLGQITVTDYLAGFSSDLGNQVDTGLTDAFTSANFDFSVNAENLDGIEFDSSIYHRMFRLNIHVGMADTQQYSLVFRDDPIGNGVSLRSSLPPLFGLGDFGVVSIGSVVSNSFTVVAIPEPNSIAFVGIVPSYLFSRGRRRRLSRDLQ